MISALYDPSELEGVSRHRCAAIGADLHELLGGQQLKGAPSDRRAGGALPVDGVLTQLPPSSGACSRIARRIASPTAVNPWNCFDVTVGAQL